MKALVFGEVLWDVINGDQFLGGAALNYAAHISKCGQRSSIISAVGRDSRGLKAIEMLDTLGVDTSMIQFSEYQTGYVPVRLKNGQPEYSIIENVAFDDIKLAEISNDKIEQYDIFYFGSLIQRNKASKQSLHHILKNYTFGDLFYDVNLRKDTFNKEIIEDSLHYATILKLSDEEVKYLGPILYKEDLNIRSFCNETNTAYPNIDIIVVTAGADGCYLNFGNDHIKIPSKPIKVVDSVGAGDSFSAAFTCVYHKTKDPIQATRIANKVGAFVASSQGSIPEYSEELKSMMDKYL